MIAKPEGAATGFPEKEIQSALIQFWAKETLERMEDPFAPNPKAGTLYELLPCLDSLTMVRSFLVIEKILRTKIPVRLLKPGGYSSRGEMLNDLLPKLRK